MIPALAHLPMGIIPWLDPAAILHAAGPWALLVVCLIIFSETGLLVGFILPGDTLLVITGVFVFLGTMLDRPSGIEIPIWWVCPAIAVAAFLGGECGYLIGKKAGPAIFERKESGLFSKANVVRTNRFFDRFGAFAVIAARFVPIVRTFAPVAAGVGHMDYRKYSLYNAVGATIWGAGVTLAGFFLGYIPPLKDFVVNYIDLILIAAVVVSVGGVLIHYFSGVAKARRTRDGELLTDAEAVVRPEDLR